MLGIGLFNLHNLLYIIVFLGAAVQTLRVLLTHWGHDWVAGGHWTEHIIQYLYWVCLVGYVLDLQRLIPPPGGQIYVLFLYVYATWSICKHGTATVFWIMGKEPHTFMDWV